MVATVPPIREYYGYKRADMIPSTYPRALTVSFTGDLIQCHLFLNASSQTITESGTWLRRPLRGDK